MLALALVTLSLSLLLTGACGSTPGASDAATAEDALAYYEQIRADLANDDGSQVPATAQLLARAAGEAAVHGSDATRAPLEELSAAAQELADVSGSELGALRIGFGEIRRFGVLVEV